MAKRRHLARSRHHRAESFLELHGADTEITVAEDRVRELSRDKSSGVVAKTYPDGGTLIHWNKDGSTYWLIADHPSGYRILRRFTGLGPDQDDKIQVTSFPYVPSGLTVVYRATLAKEELRLGREGFESRLSEAAKRDKQLGLGMPNAQDRLDFMECLASAGVAEVIDEATERLGDG